MKIATIRETQLLHTQRFSTLERKIDALEIRMDGLEGRMDRLDSKVDQLGDDLGTKLDLILARLPSP